MSLRYLDINPTPISEEGIYGIDKITADSQTGTLFYLLNKVEQYVGESLVNTINAEIFSEGLHSLGCPLVSTFYNSRIKKDFNFQYGGEKPYFDDNPIFVFQAFNFGGEDESYKEIILPNVDRFSHFWLITSESDYYYIGKKDNKICKLYRNNDETIITEYNGRKIKDVTESNIFYIFDISAMSSDLKGENIIFKVGKYLYRYNIYEDFIDDNIILWGVLPEEINNLSLGVDSNQTEFIINSFLLTDVDNHKYYTATLTDTPPVEDNSLVTFKKKDGTIKSYSTVKFIKKDGTSKTYTKVRFNKFNGGD